MSTDTARHPSVLDVLLVPLVFLALLVVIGWTWLWGNLTGAHSARPRGLAQGDSLRESGVRHD